MGPKSRASLERLGDFEPLTAAPDFYQDFGASIAEKTELFEPLSSGTSLALEGLLYWRASWAYAHDLPFDSVIRGLGDDFNNVAVSGQVGPLQPAAAAVTLQAPVAVVGPSVADMGSSRYSRLI